MPKDKAKENKKEEIKEEVIEETKVETAEEEKEQEVSQEEILQSKVDELNAQVADLKDQMLRRQAEIENYRKRVQREKEDAVKFANEKLIKDLLEFIDNLERAINAGKNSSDVESLIKGLEMAQNQLYSMLDKNWGLKAIESVGKDFDPLLHEACMQTIDESLETETVVEEFQKGYSLHDRVIRPAKVKIAKPC